MTWDGRPAHPERDGYHWLRHIHMPPQDYPLARFWDERDGWHDYEDGPAWVAARYVYLGPCLTPAEVAAREAAAAAAMMQAIVGWHDELARVTDDANRAACHRWSSHMIPKLAVPINGADALAAREAAARREGIEAAAKIALAHRFPEESCMIVGPGRHGFRAIRPRDAANDIAAAIRALLDAQPDADLARDYAAWAEGQER